MSEISFSLKMLAINGVRQVYCNLADDSVLLVSIVTPPKKPHPPLYIAGHFLFVNLENCSWCRTE